MASKLTILLFALGVLFATTSCATIALNESGTLSWIDDLIMEIINGLKDLIVGGDPENGIPPLDPILIPLVPLNITSPLLRVVGAVSDVTTTGLKELEATRVSSTLFPPTVDIEMALPEILMTGHYSINGMAAVIFPIYGEGDFMVKVGSVVVGGGGGLNMTGGISVKDFDYVLQLGQLEFRFEGLLGGDELGDVINEIVNHLGLGVFNAIESFFHDALAETLQKLINLGLSAGVPKAIA